MWYGALLVIVLLAVGLIGYAFHIRGQYDDLDRALATSAGHAITEAFATAANPHLVEGSGGLGVALRLYDANGGLRERLPGTEDLAIIDPRAILRNPSGPAFDPLAGLAPPVYLPPSSADGAFGLLTTQEQRWRVYVQPLRRGEEVTGYIESLIPLGGADAATYRFRAILLALGISGLMAALLGSWAVAGSAIRPVARITQAARAIALSRNFSHRVDVPAHRDELGRLAETFNEMLASLESAYRLQQRFISDVSHEFRAPLTVIQGNLDLLRRQKAMPESEREEALAEAEHETARLARLVADLLVLARADAGVPLRHSPVDLDTVVLEAFREARRFAHGQALALDPFEPARILGDEDRLKQLVLILLDNAVKYTPPNGEIIMGLRCRGATAEVQIHDTGVGIPAADLPHVFERFYRADPARSHDPGGTGLGLSIARWIVEQHGGHIELESDPGQGTTAKITLPVAL
ncbi:MAG: HAMP domain-containing histidine kinase [Chloroflexi bacterium]|nr:HAMP domain-containing histidine kinase [Chloroflexota bacterium]